jgi:hypothetical protein
MAEPLHREYGAAKVRQGAILLRNPIQLAIFTTGLFGSVALLLIALLLQV